MKDFPKNLWLSRENFVTSGRFWCMLSPDMFNITSYIPTAMLIEISQNEHRDISVWMENLE